MAIQIESKRLLIEERNRIAEELHDRVSQHLFGIIYAIHSMKCGWKDMTEEQKLEQMKEIQEAASSASGELRATIHSLSSSKGGKASWIGIIKSHLANQAKLNGISIDFQATKSCSSPIHQPPESFVSNHFGRGRKCDPPRREQLVHVDLSMKQGAVKLMIEDNGFGFDVRSKMNKANSGFGLYNMNALAVSLGGTFDIESKVGSGTRLILWLPLADIVNANEVTSQNTKSG